MGGTQKLVGRPGEWASKTGLKHLYIYIYIYKVHLCMQLTNVLAIRGPITRNTRLNNFTIIIILYVCEELFF